MRRCDSQSRAPERGIHAASTWDPESDAGIHPTAVRQGTLKRPEGRAPERGSVTSATRSSVRRHASGGWTRNVAEADHLQIPWTQRCSRAAAEDSRAPTLRSRVNRAHPYYQEKGSFYSARIFGDDIGDRTTARGDPPSLSFGVASCSPHRLTPFYPCSSVLRLRESVVSHFNLRLRLAGFIRG